MARSVTVWAAAVVLAAGGAQSPTLAQNGRPTFISATSVDVPENIGGPAYRAVAIDPDNDPLAYFIAFGADARRFRIDGESGELSFLMSPDFEAPADGDRDNVYRLTLGVRDGRGRFAFRPVRLTVRNLDPEGVLVRRRGTGFTLPLFVTGAGDGSGRLFVVEKQGLIKILNPETRLVNAAPFLDLTGAVATANERGLLGLAFAPDYATSGLFYVQVSAQDGPTQIRRFRVSANPDVADASSGDIVFSFAHPSGNHRAGWIGFGPDSLLYVASGDGDANVDADNPAQDPGSPLGKILRIDVSGDDFPADDQRDYQIPPDNPFASGGGLPEVFATGLRNPFRAGFDPATGILYIGDVGENAREEINMVEPGDAGRDFGWARFEGNFVIVPEESAPNATAPVIEYLHGGGPAEGGSVIGGVVNRGPVADLGGRYFFADFISKNIWSVPVASIEQGVTLQGNAFTRHTDAFTPDIGAIDNISSFGTDDAGNVYIVDFFGGEIFRLERR